jgi:RNA polymerase sigma-70 factor (ECF subfamily)
MELIGRCLHGDKGAWDELFDRHYAATGRFVFQLSPELAQEDVEEICQEVFLSVIKNLSGFNGHSQLQTWVCRIATNKTRDYVEKQRAAKRGGGTQPLSLQAEDPETGLTIDPPCPTASPDQVVLKAEDSLLIVSALEKLGDPCREIIELRYFADLSYEEISAELDLNQKTVSSRLSKCLDKLEEIARSLFPGSKAPPIPSNG